MTITRAAAFAAAMVGMAPTASGQQIEHDPVPGAAAASPAPGAVADLPVAVDERLATAPPVALSAGYVSESAYNVAGGTRALLRETGQLAARATLDLERLAGLEGSTFQTVVTWRRGHDLTTEARLGLLQQAQEVYGRGKVVRLTQAWWQQRLGQAADVKLGRTSPGDDFAAFSCDFMNVSFCGSPPGALASDYWYNGPVSQWGVRIRLAAGDRGYAAGAVYEINPTNLEPHFFVGHAHGATGMLVPVEFGVRSSDDWRVGSYKVGGWLATAPGSDVLLDRTHRPFVLTGGAPLRHTGRYGIYVQAQQQLTGTAHDGVARSGLSVFLNAMRLDRATAPIDSEAALGAFYQRLLLPSDMLGLALARTKVNDRAARAEALARATPVRDAEYTAELFYDIRPAPWLDLRPNLQWVWQPGGVRRAEDVKLVGLRAAATF